jgi:hypothetical protein
MTLSDEESTTRAIIENYNHEIIERLEGCMSVYFKPDKSRYLKSPLKDQIESGLGIIEVRRSIFKKDIQLWLWINKTCQKTVEKCIKDALTNFYNNPLDKKVKVKLK